jgi:hypothetical protein
MIMACVDFIALVIFSTDPVFLRSMARRARGELDTSFANGPASNPHNNATTVSMHIHTTGPTGDDGRNVYALNSMQKHSELSPTTSKPPSIIVSNVELNDYIMDDKPSKGLY